MNKFIFFMYLVLGSAFQAKAQFQMPSSSMFMPGMEMQQTGGSSAADQLAAVAQQMQVLQAQMTMLAPQQPTAQNIMPGMGPSASPCPMMSSGFSQIQGIMDLCSIPGGATKSFPNFYGNAQ